MHDRCNAMQNFLALVMKDIVTSVAKKGISIKQNTTTTTTTP